MDNLPYLYRYDDAKRWIRIQQAAAANRTLWTNLLRRDTVSFRMTQWNPLVHHPHRVLQEQLPSLSQGSAVFTAFFYPRESLAVDHLRQPAAAEELLPRGHVPFVWRTPAATATKKFGCLPIVDEEMSNKGEVCLTSSGAVMFYRIGPAHLEYHPQAALPQSQMQLLFRGQWVPLTPSTLQHYRQAISQEFHEGNLYAVHSVALAV